MDDTKEILISIRDALLELKSEIARANYLKEVELGIESVSAYTTDRNYERLKKEAK